MTSSVIHAVQSLRRALETSNQTDRYTAAKTILLEGENFSCELIEEILLRSLSGYESVSLLPSNNFTEYWESEKWILAANPVWICKGGYSFQRSYNSANSPNSKIFSCLWMLLLEFVKSYNAQKALCFFFACSLNSESSTDMWGESELTIYSYGDDFTYSNTKLIQEAFITTIITVGDRLLRDSSIKEIHLIALLQSLDTLKCLAPTGTSQFGQPCPYTSYDQKISESFIKFKFYFGTDEGAKAALNSFVTRQSVLGPLTCGSLDFPREKIIATENGGVIWDRKLMQEKDINVADGEVQDYEKEKFELCVICGEESADISSALMIYNPHIKLKCSHSFHLFCIKRWAVTCDHNSCPSCRKTLENYDSGQFYFDTS